MKFLNDSELDMLLISLNKRKGERDSILLRMTLFTGARSCEALAVTKADLTEGCVFLRGAKGSNDRLVPVPIDFYRELQMLASSLQDDARLFPITTRQMRRIWDQYRTNKNMGVHSLRHTLGVRHYQSCEDIHATKTVLGHVSISNTLVYLNYVESTKRLRETMKGVFNTKRKVA